MGPRALSFSRFLGRGQAWHEALGRNWRSGSRVGSPTSWRRFPSEADFLELAGDENPEASWWIQSSLEFLPSRAAFLSLFISFSFPSNFSIFFPEESKPPTDGQLVVIGNGLNHEIPLYGYILATSGSRLPKKDGFRRQDVGQRSEERACRVRACSAGELAALETVGEDEVVFAVGEGDVGGVERVGELDVEVVIGTEVGAGDDLEWRRGPAIIWKRWEAHSRGCLNLYPMQCSVSSIILSNKCNYDAAGFSLLSGCSALAP
uniref:Uncharacterized protein n=1 Tax=Kalanchoe fedtschenkoi TaxID=63787 RepID=A0A7N0V7J8_KALFE